MSLRLLYLHLAQAEKAIYKAQNNQYSDTEKQEYQTSLLQLFESIKNAVIADPIQAGKEYVTFKQDLNFIFKSLEFLDSSTFNLIPYETVECLNAALRDWAYSAQNHIIVTSLINNINEFSFDPFLAQGESFYKYFMQKYGVNFKNRLIQINIPKALARDYLVSVVHYHELGHFIDTKYSISDSLARTIDYKYFNNGFSSMEKTNIEQFLPIIKSPARSMQYDQWLRCLYMHLGEYFCDLFASQYIGQHLDTYLSYLTENSTSYSFTHPSTFNRKKVVTDFLDSQENIIVTQLNEALLTITPSTLKIRFEVPQTDDFYRFLPCEIKNDDELHGVISLGWQVWQGDWTKFQKNMSMHTLPDATKIYSIINNLIEKSIGNYIVLKKWNLATGLRTS